MEAIILAGGLGTRLRTVVPDVPKPMAPVNGRPFLEYVLELWAGQGIERVILSVGYEWKCIRRYFRSAYGNVALEYAVESAPLGTGGGLVLAARYLDSDGDFLLVNGDTYFDVSIHALVSQKERTTADVVIALFETGPNTRFSRVQVRADAHICDFMPANAAGGLANGGVYLIDRHILAGIPAAACSLETELLPRWLAAGRRIVGVEHAGRFIDIGVPQDYREAARVFARGQDRVECVVGVGPFKESGA